MGNLYVLALLTINGNFLLLRRSNNADFGSGMYSLVGGKVHSNERALQAICREVKEEVNLTLDESQFCLVHVLHRKGTEAEFIALVFAADISNLKPQNNEPDKHDDMGFFTMDTLAENILPAHKQILEHIEKGSMYSEHGW